MAVILVAELGPLPASPRIDCKAEAGEDRDRAFAEFPANLKLERRDDRNLGCREFAREGMLLRDRRIAPAPRPVELHDDRICLLEPHLEHAVLIAAERENAAITRKPAASTASAIKSGDRFANGA
jgi:hypothetical protein